MSDRGLACMRARVGVRIVFACVCAQVCACACMCLCTPTRSADAHSFERVHVRQLAREHV